MEDWGQLQRGAGFLFGVVKMFSIWLWWWVHNCGYTKSHWITHFTWVNWMVCELYLNKANRKACQFFRENKGDCYFSIIMNSCSLTLRYLLEFITQIFRRESVTNLIRTSLVHSEEEWLGNPKKWCFIGNILIIFYFAVWHTCISVRCVRLEINLCFPHLVLGCSRLLSGN